jgi:hypothetical protein
MDLPESRISTFVDEVALPLFISPQSVSQMNTATQIEHQYSFLSMIAIRRLIDRVHDAVYDSKLSYGAQNRTSIECLRSLALQLTAFV